MLREFLVCATREVFPGATKQNQNYLQQWRFEKEILALERGHKQQDANPSQAKWHSTNQLNRKLPVGLCLKE
jgi:hypothetical protein